MPCGAKMRSFIFSKGEDVNLPTLELNNADVIYGIYITTKTQKFVFLYGIAKVFLHRIFIECFKRDALLFRNMKHTIREHFCAFLL